MNLTEEYYKLQKPKIDAAKRRQDYIDKFVKNKPKEYKLFLKGSTIRYCLPYQKGKGLSRFKNNYISQNFYENWHNLTKDQLPLFNGFATNNNFKLICADFDTYPEDKVDNFIVLKVDLERLLQGKAAVTYSPSGKVKVFIPIELEPNFKKLPSKEKCMKIIQDLLSSINQPDLIKHVDPLGLTNFYLTKEMFIELKSKLNKINPIKVKSNIDNYILDESTNKKIINPAIKRHSHVPVYTDLRLYKGNLLESLKYMIKKYHLNEKLIRILMASPSLIINSGSQLLQKRLAEDLNIKQAAVSRQLHFLISKNFLSVISNVYVPGQYGKRYSAKGLLRKALSNLYKNLKKIISLGSIKFENGKWFESSMRLVRFFGSREQEFLEYIETLPGIDEKNRRKRLINLFNNWKVKNQTI